MIRRPHKGFYSKFLNILLVILLLFGLDAISSVLIKKTRLEQILEILEQDPILFWRQRRNLATTFQGMPVFTNELGFRIGDKSREKILPKTGNVFRVICLGASATFGWGVNYEDTYPCRLEALLRKKSGVNAEVINAAMIGYSTYQGKMLLEKEVIALQPDVITVSYVINDMDKYRFFRSNGERDKMLKSQSSVLISFRNFIGGSRFFQFIRRIGNWVINECKFFFGSPSEIYFPKEVRVPIDDYRSNLEDIVKFSLGGKIRVVFVKMPVNLPVSRVLPETDVAKSLRLFSQGVALAKKKDYKHSVALLERAVKYNPYLSEAHYFLAFCYRKQGKRGDADIAFSNIFRSEAYRCGRDALVYNQVMEEVARKNGIPLVDIVLAFQENKKDYYFISREEDTIHPNVSGHDVISRKLFEAIQENKILPTITNCLARGGER